MSDSQRRAQRAAGSNLSDKFSEEAKDKQGLGPPQPVAAGERAVLWWSSPGYECTFCRLKRRADNHPQKQHRRRKNIIKNQRLDEFDAMEDSLCTENK